MSELNSLKDKYAKLLEKKDSLKSAITAGEAKRDMLNKQIEEKLTELKAKYGFSSVEEAEKFLSDSEKELSELITKFEADLNG